MQVMNGPTIDLVPRSMINHPALEVGAVGIGGMRAQGEFCILHSVETRWLAVDLPAGDYVGRAREWRVSDAEKGEIIGVTTDNGNSVQRAAFRSNVRSDLDRFAMASFSCATRKSAAEGSVLQISNTGCGWYGSWMGSGPSLWALRSHSSC